MKMGGLPPVEYIRSVFSVEDLLYIGNIVFVFLLCASIIQNDSYDSSLSIDWAFSWLKDVSGDSEELVVENKGALFYSDVAIAYGKTWVQELLSSDGSVDGLLLHIGDSEESVEAYVMKNEKYSIVYNQSI